MLINNPYENPYFEKAPIPASYKARAYSPYTRMFVTFVNLPTMGPAIVPITAAIIN
jgi:hypothetical protein